MNILIDIGHPGHVHLFRPFANEMIKKGNVVLFTCRKKEFEIELLTYAGFKYKSFGQKYSSLHGKLYGLLKFDLLELIAAIKFKPDVFLSHGSMYASHAAFLLRKPHISFEDTFNFEQIKLYKPFTSVILTSNYLHPYLGNNNIDYAGYHELAYLHPNRFTPNPKYIQEIGVRQNEPYVLLRFVAWNASHDLNHKGISNENKFKVVKEFSKYAKVFISSEAKLPKELEKYRLNTSPHLIHHILYFAKLVYGESATMVSEGAVLGVPGIYLDNTGRYYTKEQEVKYNLVFNYSESESDQIKSIEKGIELLTTSDLRKKWHKKRESLLEDKIDVTAFLVWFIENFPKSIEKMKEHPNTQYNFK